MKLQKIVKLPKITLKFPKFEIVPKFELKLENFHFIVIWFGYVLVGTGMISHHLVCSKMSELCQI